MTHDAGTWISLLPAPGSGNEPQNKIKENVKKIKFTICQFLLLLWFLLICALCRRDQY